jgi:hypothetical protein
MWYVAFLQTAKNDAGNKESNIVNPFSAGRHEENTQ